MTTNHPIFTLEDGKVKISGLYVGIPTEQLAQVLSAAGFAVVDDAADASDFTGNIAGLGKCNIRIWQSNGKEVSRIIVRTERQCAEDEALAVFRQAARDLHAEPGFDYNDFGVAQKPHEINHYWDLDEGFVEIRWDGFNTHEWSHKNGDGQDVISFTLSWPVVKDEEYWRSEVD